MFLAPTTKAVSKLQSAENTVSNYLRRDALNATQKAKEVVTSAAEYFVPSTPIEIITPKACANIIDFRF
ncbi:MAG: hypothetical protein NC191_01870 [Muribaculaceae bacterium]|nr:hypothetical protein [Muribaculaceae bacterium]